MAETRRPVAAADRQAYRKAGLGRAALGPRGRTRPRPKGRGAPKQRSWKLYSRWLGDHHADPKPSLLAPRIPHDACSADWQLDHLLPQAVIGNGARGQVGFAEKGDIVSFVLNPK